MSYQIANEGFFGMFKNKNKNRVKYTPPVQQAEKTKEEIWNDDIKRNFDGDESAARSYSPINTITQVSGSVGPTDSYVAGTHYYKPGTIDLDDDNMELLVQVNLADIPYNPYFPRTGIIQVYMDTMYFDEEVVVYINPADYKKMELRDDNATDDVPWMGSDIKMTKLKFTKNDNVESLSELMWDASFGVGSYQLIDDYKYKARGKLPYISVFTVTTDGPYIDLQLKKNALNNKKTRILEYESECIHHIKFMN